MANQEPQKISEELSYPCPIDGCDKVYTSETYLKNHINSKHPDFEKIKQPGSIKTDLVVFDDAKESNWQRIEHMCDKEVEVEGINISAHQRAALMMRFRIEGKLTGDFKVVERLHVRKGRVTAA